MGEKEDLLLKAISDNDTKTALEIINHGDFDICAKLYTSRYFNGLPGTFLHVAVRVGSVQITRALLSSKGVDINEGGYTYHELETPLQCATRYSNKDLVSLLLSEGADVNKGHPLIDAIYCGNTVLAKLLLDNGANPNFYVLLARSEREFLQFTSSNNKGCPVESRNDPRFSTALKQSMRIDNKDMVELLLRYGATTYENTLIPDEQDIFVIWREGTIFVKTITPEIQDIAKQYQQASNGFYTYLLSRNKRKADEERGSIDATTHKKRNTDIDRSTTQQTCPGVNAEIMSFLKPKKLYLGIK